ncbi:mechanosensitive ion channel domain-containing protein [Flavobacterium sp. AG291]|uniref:mechanosensitive ion channel domain-containing protein n=1 Tax=Flavobacterium sp. AG291 TaxID=2184000 RepID=UPI000E0C3947|nr:mechanosensitive ion channel domain-containing protein [Flavobacterium sp. AG291]RDI10409.1 mechanosensitive ion channel-like protein [Flavobacterium sp. AG291]
MNEFLDNIFLGNTIYNWLMVIAIIVITFIALKIFKHYIFRRLKKWAASTSTTWDEFLLGIIEKSIFPILYITTVYFSIQTLNLPEKLRNILHVAYMMAITFYIIKIVIAAFKKFVFSFIQRDEDGESKEKQAGGLIAIVNIIIWILGIVFLIDNMGYNVTTIIAGLGVGGIAIALAAQAVLGDLFSYFVIFFDRPFEIGDFVVKLLFPCNAPNPTIVHLKSPKIE